LEELQDKAITESDQEHFEYIAFLARNLDSNSKLSNLDSKIFGSIGEDMIIGNSKVASRADSEVSNCEINDSELLGAQLQSSNIEGVEFFGVQNVSSVLTVDSSKVGSSEVVSPPRVTRSGKLYRKRGSK
jgi:hypothetical protein